MKETEECFGCTCLKGYEMVMEGDYWGGWEDGGKGACFEKIYD